MMLCFGIFARILGRCSKKLPEVKFVPRIAWVVDRMHSSLGPVVDSDIADGNFDGMVGNKSVVSRLLSCERGFELSNKSLPSAEVAAERFRAKVLPFIDQDKIGQAVLAILYVISKDETISTKRKETFREYFGMYKDELLQQEKFDVPDFFARVLLYTTCVDNKEGGPYAKKIAKDFIKDVVNNSWVELKWDAVTQTVQLISAEQQRLWDEIEMISDLRLSMGKMEDEVYTNIDWLGIDKYALFPNKYRRIEFKDSETKRAVMNKIARYTKLVREFVECLVASQQFRMGKSVIWPIFPDEKMRDIRQQIKDLGEDLERDLLIAGLGF